jgi:DNA-binding NtrC family response regulator
MNAFPLPESALAEIGASIGAVVLEGELTASVATYLHAHSAATSGALEIVHCATLPSASELRQAMVRARHGTLFLEDAPKLPRALQRMVLGLLRNGLLPSGEAAHVRVVVTSRVHLEDAVRGGALDLELFDELAALRVPALPIMRASLEAAIFDLVDVDAPYAAQKDAICEAFQRVYLTQLLERTRSNRSEASRLSGMDRTYLGRLLQRLGIDQ